MYLNRKKFNQLCRICCCNESTLYDLELSTYKEQTIAVIAETILRDNLASADVLPKYCCAKCIKGVIESKLLLEQLEESNNRLKTLIEKGTLTLEIDCLQKSDIWEKSVETSWKLALIDCERVAVEENQTNEIKVELLGSLNSNYSSDSVDSTIKLENDCVLLDKLVESELTVSKKCDLKTKSTSDDNDSDFEIKKNDKKKRLGRGKGDRLKVYTCTETECNNQTFTGYSSFKKHNTLLHPPIYKCPECDKTFGNTCALGHHKLYHQYVTCEICEKRLKKICYAAHKRRHEGGGKKKPPQKQPKVLCQKCGKWYSRAERHTACFKSSEVKKYSCDECEFKGSTPSVLLRHKRIHTGEKPFLCNLCGYACNQKVVLDKHQRQLHTSLPKPAKCPECSLSFHNRYDYRSHRKSHLPVVGPSGAKKQHSTKRYRYANKYKCEICPKMCSTPTELTIHKRSHTNERPHKCTVCNRDFRQKQHLQSHTSLMHNDDDSSHSFPCKTCGKVLRSQTTLRDHVRIHTGEKLSCEHCEKQFSHNSNMRKHIREVHGIRKYQKYR